MRDEHPHSPAALGRGLDLLPGFAVLALPFAWAFWALGIPGDLSPSELEASWWFRGYVALLLYAPAMALLWLAGCLELAWAWEDSPTSGQQPRERRTDGGGGKQQDRPEDDHKQRPPQKTQDDEKARPSPAPRQAPRQPEKRHRGRIK